MTRLPTRSFSARAAKGLAIVAVLGAAGLFAFTLHGLTTTATEPVALELPVSTSAPPAFDETGDIPPTPSKNHVLAFRRQELRTKPSDPAEGPAATSQPVATNIPLNEVFGIAEGAAVFSTSAPAPETDWKLPPATQSAIDDDQGEAPPLPARSQLRFESSLSQVRPASNVVTPRIRQAAADVSRAFAVPTLDETVEESAAPALIMPEGAADTQAAAAQSPPPLPVFDDKQPQPARPDDDPYGVAPLPFDEQPGTTGPAAAPVIGPVLPQAEAPAAPALSAMTASEMQSVMRLADEHTRRGFALGSRGALYSARSEFLNCLRLVAQALDAAQQTTAHVQSLNAGLRALDESDDFIPRDGKVNGSMNVSGVAATHETPLLQNLSGDVPALIALQRYYNFAQQHLASSVQGYPSGSLALHGLAKLYSVIGARQPGSIVAAEPKAIVLEQAAVAADPKNFMAANDLAVLLVRYGRTAEARTLLQNSVSTYGQPENWNNLADLHEQLGEKDLAMLARRAAQDAAQKMTGRRGAEGGASDGVPQVDWVKPDVFRGTPDATSQQSRATAVKPRASGTATPPLRRPAANEMFGTRKR